MSRTIHRLSGDLRLGSSVHDTAASVMEPIACNVLSGPIVSVQQGLAQTSVRMASGRNMIVRARWSSDGLSEPQFRINQQAVATIAADAVLLSRPDIWLGKQRWNRWTGRIVLVGPEPSGGPITVKVKGEGLTLTCDGPVFGLNGRPEAWAEVNMVVDPMNVRLAPRHQDDPRRISRVAVGAGANADGQIWLKGRLQTIREVASGWLLSLEVDGAHVAALVSAEAMREMSWAWMPGERIAIHVDQWDAQVKPLVPDAKAIPCRLVYLG